MEKRKKIYIEELVKRYPMLENVRNEIIAGYQIMEETYENGGKLLVAGNGGSAADSEHIVGELMKSFDRTRRIPSDFVQKLVGLDKKRGVELAKKLEQPLTAISLVGHEAFTTAYINDVDASIVIAQQLYGYGKRGDVFLGISTSGNSDNIINAAVVARAMGVKVIGLTGFNGGKLVDIADVTVVVPEKETYKIQEIHLPIYHCWCHMLEEHFFGCTI